MTKEEFIKKVKDVAEAIRKEHPELRKGQSIFNVVDIDFDHIARIAQFDYGIDCFYDDTMIDPFLNKCYEILSPNENN